MTTVQESLPIEQAFERLAREMDGFERRDGQLEMASRWSEALEHGGTLAVEAPTGVGKSLAYLIPALLHRLRGSGPILVSTHTKALQDQLLRHDLPLAFRAIGRPMRASMLLGRASYLCRRRAQARLAQRKLFLDKAAPGARALDDDALARMDEWVERTTTGILDELPAFGIHLPPGMLAEIASDPFVCAGNACEPSGGCFA
ncbi:MAG TPA: DEAD/DEAH box helicase, partial [Candidatus Eisenbacteria bacterium]|nr:DEAD/DEAH box helicase [Candidatus Eisenbacteria bacterium]